MELLKDTRKDKPKNCEEVGVQDCLPHRTKQNKRI